MNIKSRLEKLEQVREQTNGRNPRVVRVMNGIYHNYPAYLALQAALARGTEIGEQALESDPAFQQHWAEMWKLIQIKENRENRIAGISGIGAT